MCSASSCSSVIASGVSGRGTFAADDLRGKIRRHDQGLGRENHGPLDGVAQLADVARPGVVANRLPHRLAEAGNVLAVLPREEVQQVFGQGQDVGRPLPQAAAP